RCGGEPPDVAGSVGAQCEAGRIRAHRRRPHAAGDNTRLQRRLAVYSAVLPLRRTSGARAPQAAADDGGGGRTLRKRQKRDAEPAEDTKSRGGKPAGKAVMEDSILTPLRRSVHLCDSASSISWFISTRIM